MGYNEFTANAARSLFRVVLMRKEKDRSYPPVKSRAAQHLYSDMTHCKNQPVQFLMIIVSRVFPNLPQEVVYHRGSSSAKLSIRRTSEAPRTRIGQCNRPARELHNCKYLTPLPMFSLHPTMEDVLPEMKGQLAKTIPAGIAAVSKRFGNSETIYKVTQARRVDCYYPDIGRSPALDEELHPSNGCWPRAEGEKWSGAVSPW